MIDGDQLQVLSRNTYRSGSIRIKNNPYEPCVANKVVTGCHFNIVGHADNLKLSYKDSNPVDEMIQHLKDLYKELSN